MLAGRVFRAGSAAFWRGGGLAWKAAAKTGVALARLEDRHTLNAKKQLKRNWGGCKRHDRLYSRIISYAVRSAARKHVVLEARLHGCRR